MGRTFRYKYSCESFRSKTPMLTILGTVTVDISGAVERTAEVKLAALAYGGTAAWTSTTDGLGRKPVDCREYSITSIAEFRMYSVRIVNKSNWILTSSGSKRLKRSLRFLIVICIKC